MSLKQWFTTGVTLTALAIGGCGYGKREDYPELRRINSQPNYLRSLYDHKCPETTPPQYCHPKRR